MKIKFILYILLFSSVVFSQKNALKSKTLTWFGLDFSNANFIGTKDFSDSREIKYTLFSEWNSTIISESDKYNFKKFYFKEDVIYKIDIVTNRNENTNVEKAISNNYANSVHLNKDTIQTIIDSYNIPDEMKGLGLVYIVESFNKFSNIGFYYVVFFNIANKQVIYTERFDGKAKGIGLKNHWANTVIYVLKKSSDKYKKTLKNL